MGLVSMCLGGGVNILDTRFDSRRLTRDANDDRLSQNVGATPLRRTPYAGLGPSRRFQGARADDYNRTTRNKE